jgi:hypothetical protein
MIKRRAEDRQKTNGFLNNKGNQVIIKVTRFQTTGWQHTGYIIPQAVSHSLVFLKIDRMVTRNMLS